MRITLVGPVFPFRGGIAHFTVMLARSLTEAGHILQLISFRRQYPQWLYPGQSDRDPSHAPIDFPAEYVLDPIDLLTWKKTTRQVSEFHPDLVVVSWWITFWAPAFAALANDLQRKGLPIVFLIHNVIPHEARFWDQWLTQSTLNHGNYFIVMTTQQEKRLLEIIPEAKTWLCPHPVYDMFASQPLSKSSARQRLGISQEEKVVLFFGIVRPYKGLRDLLTAISLLKEQGKSFFLVVAGEFWQDISKYQQQIQHLSLENQVRLENRYIPNEEVGIFFSAADVFVAPYTGGTQSGAVKIAMSFHLPLVVTETIAENISAQEANGLCIVPPGDPYALAKGIQSLLAEPAKPVTIHSPAETGWKMFISAIESMHNQEAHNQVG